MEKRILLAFLLSIAVMYGFRIWTASKTPTPAASAPVTAAVPAAAATEAPPPTASAAPKPASVAGNDQEIRADHSEDVAVDTTLYTATISNVGAVLKSFRLKRYADPQGKAIELIDAAGGAKNGWPLATTTADPKVDEALSAANYVTKRDGNRVTMEFAANGIHSTKTFNFDPENYRLTVDANLLREGKPFPGNLTWQGGFGDQSIPPDPAKRFVVLPTSSGYESTAVAKLKDPIERPVSQVGVEDQYFLAMMMLPANRTVKVTKQEYTGADQKAVVTSVLSVPLGDSPTSIYLGPKDPDWLKKVDPQLVRVIDYGWLEFIAKPLAIALLWIHKYIGNFGWAIIVLTAFINFVLFPLRIKQQLSMQKMQKIQPQMKTLQDRYKKLKANDPKRMEVQTQMMGLYKEHGINPMSGCLPLLLQMPFLYAIYRTLAVTIELRQAPWLLWIRDLSQPDPYHIMPLLMAGTMIIQQKATPTAVDPAQARMMMIMPIMLIALFWWSQSGLMLYWLTSNVVGVGQQFFINKYWGSPATAPAKRSNKKGDRED